MKTTLNIADSLLESAKDLARKENTTLTEIVELSLREFLMGKQKKKSSSLWKKSHFGSKGLVAGLEEKEWSEIRDIAYGLKR